MNYLKNYDMVLGTVRGNFIEKSIKIVKRGGIIVSLIGPLDEAFALARGLNFGLRIIFRLMSFKIKRLAAKHDIAYSFLFVRPDGMQLTEIKKLIEEKHINPVIDKVFTFGQAQDALNYLAEGHSKGKVIITIKDIK
ncbi:zinc-binding alcohol dehydrogenase family protein [Biostraticola tofi]|uniref:Zinc-binding alcohol dehydrogenase family protein n=1 Tax=Biostraticola tofi TaxID=466109 RepID=A0A4R3YQR6_9GAMM|nr:zinc-binding alcohol dehydrogenase family protein [Biostraticola tofi]